MVIISAVESILSIVLMIIIGYVLTARGWFDKNASKLITKLVCELSLPALMLSSILNNFDRSKLWHLGFGLVAPFASIALCYLVSDGVAKIINVKQNRRGTFKSMFFVSNTIFIGLPVNIALFGEKSVPYVFLYYIANTTFFWTIGAYGISEDGNCRSESIFSIKTLKRIASPPFMGFLVGIILVAFGVSLPGFVMDTCKYLGNITTPLAMIFIGITIYSVKITNIKIDKDVLAVIIGRFIISPLIVFAIAYFMPIPLLMKKVFIIQAAMPVMTNTAIIAKAYNADEKYAAVMIVTSTIASLIFIPFYMLFLS